MWQEGGKTRTKNSNPAMPTGSQSSAAPADHENRRDTAVSMQKPIDPDISVKAVSL